MTNKSSSYPEKFNGTSTHQQDRDDDARRDAAEEPRDAYEDEGE